MSPVALLLVVLVGAAPLVVDAPTVRWTRAGSTLDGDTVPLAATSDQLIVASGGPKLVQYRLENGTVVRSTRLRNCHLVTHLEAVGEWLAYFCQVFSADEADPMVVPVPAGLLAVHNLRTGRRAWKKAVGALSGPFVSSAQTIYVVDDLEIKAVALASGAVEWSAELPLSRRYVLAAAGERVFVAAEAGALIAFGRNGVELWRQVLPSGTPSLVADAEVVVANVAVRGDLGTEEDDVELVRAYRTSTGEPLWQSNGGAARCAPVALIGKNILLVTQARGGTGGLLRAIELASGKVRWQAPVEVDCDGHGFEPQPAGEAVLVWARAPAKEEQVAEALYDLAAFELGTGKPLWRYRVPDRARFLLSPPVCRQGVVGYADGSQLRTLVPPPRGLAPSTSAPTGPGP